MGLVKEICCKPQVSNPDSTCIGAVSGVTRRLLLFELRLLLCGFGGCIFRPGIIWIGKDAIGIG